MSTFPRHIKAVFVVLELDAGLDEVTDSSCGFIDHHPDDLFISESAASRYRIVHVSFQSLFIEWVENRSNATLSPVCGGV